MSPKFLYRIEAAGAATSTVQASKLGNRVSDIDLASRLSFFLWSSVPDDELIEAARRGRLRDDVVLQRQVARMLTDDRASALVDNFVGQWLFLRNLADEGRDGESFPNFDETLRDAFATETRMFFQSIVREDRSLLDVLNADYTFVNERLARHYQIP